MLVRRNLRSPVRAKDPPFAGLSPREAQATLQKAFPRRKRTSWVLPSILLVWGLAAAYYIFTPASYVSKWTLILPVSNGGSSVSLDSIGQTSTLQSQTFGSINMSPKVIYREIADSDQVRTAAAQILRVSPGEFGRARLRLIDETALMLFQIQGRSPEEAQRKAQAMQMAFGMQLDALRRDEVERRGQTTRESLKLYQATLDAARERILEFQRTTGMLSLSQFNEAVSSAELLRRKLSDARAEHQKLSSQQASLMSRIGLDPMEAAAVIKLASDPAFTKLASSFAEANGSSHENNQIYGPNHPARAMAQLKMNGAMAEIQAIARRSRVDSSVDLKRLILSVNGSHQADLLHSIISNESLLEGRRKEIASLEAEILRLEQEIARMSQDAARLEYLKKDHLVAEAVFTSAAARLDINRSDLYSSYPLVQTLAVPDLPTERNQPQLILALGGGFVGSFFVLLAWGAAWIRRTFGKKSARKTAKSGSSTGPSSAPGVSMSRG